MPTQALQSCGAANPGCGLAFQRVQPVRRTASAQDCSLCVGQADSLPIPFPKQMRVIAGEFRSRRLKTLPGQSVRPTPDRLREALFNVLTPRIAGAIFLDAYAGSGSVGIEALSRGAASAIFIEKSFAAIRIIRENLASLGLEDRATALNGAQSPFDVVTISTLIDQRPARM